MPARQDSAGFLCSRSPWVAHGVQGGRSSLGMVVQSTHKSRFCQAHLTHLEMLPASLGRCRERDFAVAGLISRRIERLPPVCPTCLWVSFSDAKATLLGGRRRAAPAWRNAAIVWVSPISFLLQPGGSGVFPAGPELPSQPEFQNPSRAVGSGQGRSCWPCCTHLGWFSAPCSLILC